MSGHMLAAWILELKYKSSSQVTEASIFSLQNIFLAISYVTVTVVDIFLKSPVHLTLKVQYKAVDWNRILLPLLVSLSFTMGWRKEYYAFLSHAVEWYFIFNIISILEAEG